jgi:hypothetical protein
VGLGRAVADFVHACQASAEVLDKEKLRDTTSRWLRDRYTLLATVASLARLSAVDGCTVFDADLQLLGFGGRIAVAGNSEKKDLFDARENRPLHTDVMLRLGTRHASAYRLCQAHDGISCYVVSQDGQVTAMWSDPETVHRWTPYWPCAKRSDLI